MMIWWMSALLMHTYVGAHVSTCVYMLQTLNPQHTRAIVLEIRQVHVDLVTVEERNALHSYTFTRHAHGLVYRSKEHIHVSTRVCTQAYIHVYAHAYHSSI